MQEIHSSGILALYDDMNKDLAACRNTLSFPQLWSKIAPNGNVYRLNALTQERLRHCVDLGTQMDSVAEEFAELLGGKDLPIADRRQVLLRELKNTRVVRREGEAKDSLEEGETRTGFLPLEEFLEERVDQGLLFNSPEDEEAHSMWQRHQVVGCIIFIIQALGPVFLLLDKWHAKANYLRDPRVLWQRLRLEDMICLHGRHLTDWSTILMATLFMLLVLARVRHYAEGEFKSVTKESRLIPMRMWNLLGSLANGWCVFSIMIMLPIYFWNMEGTTEVIVNSLGVLFIFTLDDFDGLGGAILAMNTSKFQRAMCWHVALLSQCPVTLRDLINPKATHAGELWRIEFDSTGLLAVEASSSEPSEARRYAVTRLAPLMPSSTSETTPLMESAAKAPQRASLMENISKFNGRIAYTTSSATGSSYTLPSSGIRIRSVIWYILVWLCRALQLIMPVLWILINKPCPHPRAHDSHTSSPALASPVLADWPRSRIA